MADKVQRQIWDREFAKQYHDMTKEDKVAFFKTDLLSQIYTAISELSEEAADKVLKHACQACVKIALSHMIYLGYDPDKDDIDAFIVINEKLEKLFSKGRVHIVRHDNLIDYLVDHGRCACWVARDYGEAKTFPNMCKCTVGWLETVYSLAHKGPVEVRIIETYSRGGNCCHFKIRLL